MTAAAAYTCVLSSYTRIFRAEVVGIRIILAGIRRIPAYTLDYSTGWMCGVTLRDKVPTVELRRRLGIEGVVEVMRRGRLRWFGHVEWKEVDDWVSACG